MAMRRPDTTWGKQATGTERAYKNHQENIAHAQRIRIWETVISVPRNYNKQMLSGIGQIADSVCL